MTTSSSLDCITAYVETLNGEFTFNEAGEILTMQVKNDLHTDTYYFKLYSEKLIFTFYIVPDFPVPAQNAAQVVEYITRANMGMLIGNFEFDYGDAKIRFKSAVSFAGDRLSQPLVAAAVEPAIRAWKTYLPGAIEVMADVASPIRALNKIDYGE